MEVLARPGLQGQKRVGGSGREAVPELFAEVRQQGVQHHQQRAEHLGQHLAGGALIRQGRLPSGTLQIFRHLEAPLAQLQGPIAHLVPGELIESLGGLAQGVGAVALRRVAIHAGQAREDPAIGQGQCGGIGLPQAGRRLAAQVHQREAGGVEELVGEVAGGLHRGGGAGWAVVVEADVLAGAGHLAHQGKAQGIGAIALDQRQRIDAIARRFAHLAVVLITHQAVDVDIAERRARLGQQRSGQHRHASHPEKDDVEAGHQHAGGVPGGHIGGLARAVGRVIGLGLRRPAQGGEGPEPAGKPGVEHIRVLLQHQRSTAGGMGRTVVGLRLGPRFRLVAGHHIGGGIGDDAAGFAHHKPGGDAVAPPELAADAPIADVGEPVAVHLAPALRHKAGLAALQGRAAMGGQGLGAHEPLGGEQGFHRHLAPVGEGHAVAMGLGFDQQPLGLHRRHHGTAGLKAVEASETTSGGVHGAVLGHHRDLGQTMALADREIVGIVGGRDFDAAGAERGIHMGVGDDRDGAMRQGQINRAPHQVGVTGVVGIHRHSGVPQHRFRAGGGHHHVIHSGGQAFGAGRDGRRALRACRGASLNGQR